MNNRRDPTVDYNRYFNCRDCAQITIELIKNSLVHAKLSSSMEQRII